MKRTSAQVFGPVLACLASLAAFAGIAGAYQTSDAGSGTTIASGVSTLSSASSPDTTAPASLVQLSPCAGSEGQGQQASAPPAGGGTEVTFSIASSTVARVGANGLITAVATNTGCVPQPGNDFYIQTPDGAYRSATSSQVDQMLNATYSGDWTTPDIFHPFG